MQYSSYFYPCVVLLSVLVSYTDLRRHVIKNRHLIVAFAYGITTYVCFWFYGEPVAFFRLAALNLLTAFLIAYVLYYKDVWRAGDAKLFITLSFLTPSYRYLALFKLPTIALFVNIALISFIFMLILELKYLVVNIRYLPRELVKEKSVQFLYALAMVFSVTWIVRYIFPQFNFLDPLLSIGFIYISYVYLSRFLKKITTQKKIFFYAIVIGFLIRACMQPQFFYSPERFRFQFISIMKYTFFFSVLDFIFSVRTAKFKDKKELRRSHTAMAPFMSIGALALNTPFILFVLQALSFLKR